MPEGKVHIKGLLFLVFTFLLISVSFAQSDSSKTTATNGYPVTLYGDTLFFIHNNLGPFSASQRADAVNKILGDIIDRHLDPDSIKVVNSSDLTSLELGYITILSVTDKDAAFGGKDRKGTGEEYAAKIKKAIKDSYTAYNPKKLLIDVGIAILILAALIGLFWLMRAFFPKSYLKVESWEGTILKAIKVRKEVILSEKAISASIIIILKLVRLAISMALLYFFIIYVLSLFPWTKALNIRPLLRGLLFAVILTSAGFALLKAVNTSFKILDRKTFAWKGTLIKPVKVKDIEVLSDQRILEALRFVIKISRFVVLIFMAYFYFTILFSFFTFTRTWASTLFGYITKPLGSVLLSFVNFLPNLFTILVIVFVTRYVIKFIKLIFNEIETERVSFPQFPSEWAKPTFKIVRFLTIVFAAIVIFPYLPGSDSPIFRGVSIFLGILFSLGSTSAVSNIVGGVVLTYMRPFKHGDRVRIADTVGDVVEKTLLVTRVRTIKNVDITIPNAMVLGSHIINFSSSAKNKGLILHTTVTIGYDAPWRKVHELLKAAAKETESTLREPEPFILQTALSDFYVNYELNVYTDKPNVMAKIYSDLHQKIQDKFNEAGVEIMSPSYTGVRDGNKMQIPDEYLPKDYKQPKFKISPLGDILGKGGGDKAE